MYSKFRFYLIKETILAALLLSIVLHAYSYEIVEDLTFSEEDTSLTLDFYLPKEKGEPKHCIIVIQGGGFAPRSGQRFKPFAAYHAECGFAAALVSYRGRQDHGYMDTIAGNKAAVRFIRVKGSVYKIDPDRIGAMGRSAGGALTAMLAVTGDDPELDGNGGREQYQSSIQAAVAFCGVFDFISRFTNENQIALQPGVNTKIINNGEWIGPPFSTDQHDWINVSAINHGHQDDPPILLLHYKDDATVPWIQTEIMNEAMKRTGAKS